MQKVKSLILISVWSMQHPIAGQKTQHQELINCWAHAEPVFMKKNWNFLEKYFEANMLKII